MTSLLGGGASCNPQDNHGWTPLYYASVKPDNDVVFSLLKHYTFNCHPRNKRSQHWDALA